MAGGELIRWPDLVQRLRAGDSAAEEEFCAFFYPRIRTLAAMRLHNQEEAGEIAQETMLAVLPALRDGRLREPEKLPGFVFGTSRNLINNYRRKAARSIESSPLPENIAAPESLSEAGQDAQDQCRHAVRLILRTLKPVDRRILLLTLLEGMTPREIAPLVGLDADVVRTRKSRALSSVAGRWKEVTRMRTPDHKQE